MELWLTYTWLPFCSGLDRERMKPTDQPSGVAGKFIEPVKLLLGHVTCVYGHVQLGLQI